jgi:hypothetical protein
MPELSMIGSGSLSSSGLHGFCGETQLLTEIPGLLKCLSNIRICPAQCRPQVPPHGKQKAL